MKRSIFEGEAFGLKAGSLFQSSIVKPKSIVSGAGKGDADLLQFGFIGCRFLFRPTAMSEGGLQSQSRAGLFPPLG